MSEISKQALKVDNNQSFPDNNSGQITPSDLRAFNVNMIDSLVDSIGYTADSSSWNNSISALNTFSASQQPSFDALNQFSASQLTINTGVNLFTQSTSGRLNALENDTANLELFTSSINQIIVNGNVIGTSTRLFFNGFVSASIVPNVDGPIASITVLADQTFASSASFNAYTASTNAFTESAKISISALNSFTASQNSFNASATASLVELLNLSSSLSGGYATQGELDQSASVLQGNIDALAASQAISNSYFATTGSNTFRGIETFEDAGGNATSLVPASGSLMLVAKGFTSASAHLSASANNQVNIIWKNNNNTADTVISGSNNIFPNPAAPTAGFKRYIGSQNIMVGPVIPQISASMQFSPAINANIGGIYTVRGPVSASTMLISNNISPNGQILLGTSAVLHAQGLVAATAVTNNVVGGTLSVIANQSNIQSTTNIVNNNINGTVQLTLSSSAIVLSANTINDTNFNLINQYSSGSAGFGQPVLAANTIGGGGNIVYVTGSQQAGTLTLNPNINQNIVIGQLNTLFSNASTARLNPSNRLDQSIVATAVLGNRLIVSASSDVADGTTFGSVFVGRNNADDGRRNKSSDIIFAVGTGVSTSARKTGFLIDTGSNAFIEGSLNLSGSLSVTGSINNNVFSASIVSSTASIDFNSASFFTLTLPASTTTHINVQNAKPGQSAMIEISTAGTLATASFSTNVYQPSASFYVPTNGAGNDILTLSSFDSNKVYLVSVKTMTNI